MLVRLQSAGFQWQKRVGKTDQLFLALGYPLGKAERGLHGLD